MATRTTTRSWLSAQRVGDDIIRLRDGGLRAVLECGAPAVGAALEAIATIDHRAQVVIPVRQPAVGDDAPIATRLRASFATLLSELSDGRRPVVRRLLVVVPGYADDADGASTSLVERAAEVGRRLQRANLDPVRLSGGALDDLLGFDVVHEGRCEVRTDRGIARTLIVTRCAERLRPELLDALPCDHDLSFHTAPERSHGLVELSAYVTLWAASRETIDAANEQAQALLATHGVRARRPYLQAEPALVSTMPLGLDLAGCGRALPARAVPLGTRANGPLPDEGRALLYGVDPGTRRPLTLDRFGLPNPHALVLGDATARSRFLILEALRARLAGRPVHMIDSTGSYRSAVTALDGRAVSAVGFDPLAVPAGPGALESRVQLLTALIERIAGELTEATRAAVTDAVAFAYAARGYSREAGRDAGLTPPTLDEIAAALERRGASAGCGELPLRLRAYVGGDGRRLLGRRPLPQLGPLSIHDLTVLPETERPAAALLALDRLWRGVPRNRSALVLVDALDATLRHGAPVAFLTSLMAAPERRLGLTLAADDATALLGGPLRAAAADAGLTVLLRQQPTPAAERLAEAFRLTPAEQSWLLQASVEEGLLIAEGRRLAFRSVASDEEARLISGGTP